jgi:hypothetical protein
MAPERRVAARRGGRARALGASAGIATGSLLLLAMAGRPVASAGPLPLPSIVPTILPPLPTLVVPLSTILPPLPTILPPLPTLVVPTLPVPTFPVPTFPVPTFPVPTFPVPSLPVPSVPLPTLPLPSGLPGPTGSAPSGSASAGPFTSTPPAGSGLATPDSSGAAGAVGSVEGPSVDQQPSPFQFVLPLVIAGIPIAVILLIVGLQVAGGAAWLPIIRRWLNRTPTTGP